VESGNLGATHASANGDDVHDSNLLASVRPTDWSQPRPSSRYNLVVIGAGTAGLVCAAGAAILGAKVALVERHRLGGDCLNTGCVPSKALIRAARAAHAAIEARRFGIDAAAGRPDFGRVMERLREVRAEIGHHDSVKRFREFGVEIFFGPARFDGAGSVDVAGTKLRYRKAVIATGARAVAPPIAGLADAGYLTNESVFELRSMPSRLMVIGAGPVGCELAQAFARLGAEVTLVEVLPRPLPNEDREAAAIVTRSLEEDGVRIRLDTTILSVETVEGGKRVHMRTRAGNETVTVDEILVSAGRAPNVEELGLDAVGVDHDHQRGVRVNDRMQTSNPRIYAAGDVAQRHKFTHTADAAARIVLRNALFFGRKKLSALTVPWCIYTSPEIAHVGLSEHEATGRGIALDTIRIDLAEVDRSLIDGAARGFVKIHVKQGSGRILGATIVSEQAGNLISEITLAMVHGIGLGRISSVIHPYPTVADAIRMAADAYNRRRLSPRIHRLLAAWFGRRR